jgi:hypothetical protein
MGDDHAGSHTVNVADINANGPDLALALGGLAKESGKGGGRHLERGKETLKGGKERERNVWLFRARKAHPGEKAFQFFPQTSPTG